LSEEEPEPTGTLRPISGRALALCAVVGLATGRALHPVGTRLTGEAPAVSLAQPLTLVLAAAIMGFLAWHTWRTVQVEGRRLEVHHAVNRLVLARACALAGSLVAGAYAGLAIGWIGDAATPAEKWLLRSALAAVAALGVTAGSLVLERACRTPGGRAQP
jgi:hypothetical protein